MSDLFETGLLPMLAREAREPFDSPGHLFEVKWDGYRGLAFLGDGTSLRGRHGTDITHRFATLLRLHESAAGHRLILDGEIVAVVGGRPSFSALQAGEGQVVYVAFDLLYVDGEPLLDQPLWLRRELLHKLVATKPPLVVSEGIHEYGRRYFEAVRNAGLEGLMAKELTSPYRPGRRTAYWLKIKVWRDLDAVVCGYTKSTTGGDPFAALLVGGWQENGLLFLGYVGTGFGEREKKLIMKQLLTRAQSPFAPGRGPRPAELRAHGPVVYVEPGVCCRVRYREITADGRLRHASFAGLRPDLVPSDCVFPPGSSEK